MSQLESNTPDSIANSAKPHDRSRAHEGSVLPDDGAELRTVLAEMKNASRGEWPAVLRADQFKRWQHGQRVLAEAYLEHFPELRADEEAALDLIYSEVVLREERGEQPQLEEYVRRFPQQQERLTRQFELHQALLRCASESVTPNRTAENATPCEVRAEPQSLAGIPSLSQQIARQDDRMLRLRCPHCHNPVDLLDHQAEEVLCLAQQSGRPGQRTPRLWIQRRKRHARPRRRPRSENAAARILFQG